MIILWALGTLKEACITIYVPIFFGENKRITWRAYTDATSELHRPSTLALARAPALQAHLPQSPNELYEFIFLGPDHKNLPGRAGAVHVHVRDVPKKLQNTSENLSPLQSAKPKTTNNPYSPPATTPTSTPGAAISLAIRHILPNKPGRSGCACPAYFAFCFTVPRNLPLVFWYLHKPGWICFGPGPS